MRRRAAVALLGALALALLGALALGGCALPRPQTALVDARPATVVSVGSHITDVTALMGAPNGGVRTDPRTALRYGVWEFPWAAITAETTMKDGAVRREDTRRVHLFFDRDGRIDRIGLVVNPHYPTLVETEADRITLAAHARDTLGRTLPLRPVAIPVEPPRVPTPPVTTGGS